jgi:hypothetical protein
MRMIVRRSAETTIVPRDGEVERAKAAWMVCVDVGGGGSVSGLEGGVEETVAGCS